MTVAGVVALRARRSATWSLYLAGYEISGERPALVGVLLYSGLMFAGRLGMLQGRATGRCSGMQALLGLTIVLFSLLVIAAPTSIVARPWPRR